MNIYKQGKICRQFSLLIRTSFIGQIFHRVVVEVESIKGEIVILASCECHHIRVNENLVQHPSNNTSIMITKADFFKHENTHTHTHTHKLTNTHTQNICSHIHTYVY